jgi:hypothetical protein
LNHQRPVVFVSKKPGRGAIGDDPAHSPLASVSKRGPMGVNPVAVLGRVGAAAGFELLAATARAAVIAPEKPGIPSNGHRHLLVLG